MSYGIINRVYGVDISYGELTSAQKTLMKDLYARYWAGLTPDLQEEWETPSEAGDGPYYDYQNEILPEEDWSFTAYSGSGDPPLGIGFELNSWAYWEFKDTTDREGKVTPGILSTARQDELPEGTLEKWNELVPVDVRELLAKHGIEPGVFWTTSTS